MAGLIVQSGSVNTTAQVVPNLIVQLVQPNAVSLNGVPTNEIGIVGTAQFGPVNQPIVIGSMSQYVATFGNVMARKYDMGTHVAVAYQQGANNFTCVRVTDGTDAAATFVVSTSCITFTALYTGSLGNSITVNLSAGSKASTWCATVGIPGFVPEIYNNIAGTANTFWVNLAAAINNGTGTLRPKSNFIVATAGAGTTAPAAATYTLTGGADGVTTLSGSVLVGSATTRTGMYALQNQGCSILDMCDVDDSTQWTTIDGLAQSEGMYAIQVVPASTSITAAITAKQTAGLNSYSSKLMHGDWIYWNDTINQTIRKVSPQGFVAGLLANLSPEQSSLNKQVVGVVGTEMSGGVSPGTVMTYSQAQLQQLIQGGLDVITNPIPAGYMWGVRSGTNSSSNAAINGDNYTRMTNYIASTLSAGMGVYVGKTITPTLLNSVKSTLVSFLQNLVSQGMLGTLDGSLPYSVICNTTNNPFSRTSLGYVQADVQVNYLAINREFIVNLQGGQTVQVAQAN